MGEYKGLSAEMKKLLGKAESLGGGGKPTLTKDRVTEPTLRWVNILLQEKILEC